MSKLDGVNFPTPPASSAKPISGALRSGAFAARLAAHSASATLAGDQTHEEKVAGGDIIAAALAESNNQAEAVDSNKSFTHAIWAGEQRQENAQAAKTTASAQNNPFGQADANEVEGAALLAGQADQSSLNTRILRLQLRMQREAARFMFDSNVLKSDHDGNKTAINNIR